MSQSAVHVEWPCSRDSRAIRVYIGKNSSTTEFQVSKVDFHRQGEPRNPSHEWDDCEGFQAHRHTEVRWSFCVMNRVSGLQQFSISEHFNIISHSLFFSHQKWLFARFHQVSVCLSREISSSCRSLLALFIFLPLWFWGASRQAKNLCKAKNLPYDVAQTLPDAEF